MYETNSEKIGGRRLVRQWFSARSGRLSFFPRNQDIGFAVQGDRRSSDSAGRRVDV